jgi:hypothetical protein
MVSSRLAVHSDSSIHQVCRPHAVQASGMTTVLLGYVFVHGPTQWLEQCPMWSFVTHHLTHAARLIPRPGGQCRRALIRGRQRQSIYHRNGAGL